MLKHYWKTAMRNLARNKLIAVINIGGLAIGLACALLILLYLRNELSYDQFHRQKDRIYQLTCNRIEENGKQERFAIAAQVQGPSFQRGVPEIEEYTRVFNTDAVVKLQNDLFNESVTWVDPSFFKVFSFALRSGDPATALSEIHNMVMTETAAVKYFGTKDAVGKSLLLEIAGKFESFVVSAVAVDPPPNSSIHFNVLLSFPYFQRLNPDNGWMWVSFPTYFLLAPGSNIQAVQRKMQKVYEDAARDEIELNSLAGYHNRFEWSLQPMAGMHFKKEYSGIPDASDPVYAYILGGIALFVLAIASINFINLTISQSLKRSREIGIRKVVGSLRGQLMLQFLGEAVLMCLLAFVLSIGLAACALPAFGSMAAKPLNFSRLFDGQLLGISLALVVLTGGIAGCYPALVLSGFRPVAVLGGQTPYTGRNRLARVLVVVQFALAAILVVSTLFMYAQFRLLTTTDTGYDDRNLLSFTLQGVINKPQLMDYYKTQFSEVPGVVSAGYQNIGRFGGKTIADGHEFAATYIRVDSNYSSAMGVPLLYGRNFGPLHPADSALSALVNESFAKRMGILNPVGRTIDYLNIPGWGSRRLTIVGALRDFHYGSMKEPIEPMLFLQDNALPLGKMLLRLRPGQVPATLLLLDKTFHRLIPDRPFVYAFADETNRKAYEPERRWGQIISWGAIMTILVAGTGLFGLSSITIQRRKKEISIRKVIGGGVAQLSIMIAREFGNLVLVAFLIAAPISYLLLHRWLEAYPYRVTLSPWRFALAGLIVWSISLLTVSYHALRAARANPVAALRSE